MEYGVAQLRILGRETIMEEDCIRKKRAVAKYGGRAQQPLDSLLVYAWCSKKGFSWFPLGIRKGIPSSGSGGSFDLLLKNQV